MNNLGIAMAMVTFLVVSAVPAVVGHNELRVSEKLSLFDICNFTDYKDACKKSIANTKNKQPKELFKVVLNYTGDAISSVIKHSTLYRQAAKEKSTKDALDVCDIVLDRAIDDLKRTFNLFGTESGHINAAEVIEDLKTWLSAVVTNQDTCIDAFAKTSTETGKKMFELLKTTKQLSSNALAIANEIGSIISTLNSANKGGSRKMLVEEQRELAATSTPDAIVALDGSGKYKTVTAAVNAVPASNNKTFVIKIKAGVYKEQVDIPKGKNKITFIGDGPYKTRITASKNFAAGVKTFKSATVAINADDFTAKNLAIENSAGPKGHQAVALRVSGDRAIFYNVNLDGYQDTLYTHTYRQFYRFCRISGTIDFVFGDAIAVFQKCDFIVRQPMESQSCMVTAQGRSDARGTGIIVIQDGHIMATNAFLKTKPMNDAYLGRPWKQYSRTIIMQSNIDKFISPDGWSPWSGNFALDTLYYVEYNNRGPGAATSGRVKWKGIRHLSANQVLAYTPGKLFGGDQWIKDSGVAYDAGMMKV